MSGRARRWASSCAATGSRSRRARSCAAGAALPVRLLGEDLALFRTDAAARSARSTPAARIAAPRSPTGSSTRLAALCLPRLALRPRRALRRDPVGARPTRPARAGAHARIPRRRARAGWSSPTSAPSRRRCCRATTCSSGPGVLRDIGRALIPCNWLQIMENSVDPTHLEWLHGHHLASVRRARRAPGAEPLRAAPRGDRLRRLSARHHQAARARGREPRRRRLADRPSAGLSRDGAGRRAPAAPLPDPRARRRHPHAALLVLAATGRATGAQRRRRRRFPVYDVPFRDERGEFLVDFVDGGDIMAWVSQGAIADRTRELLVDTDRGVVLLRAPALRAARARARRRGSASASLRHPEENADHRAAAGAREVRPGRDLPRRVASR